MELVQSPPLDLFGHHHPLLLDHCARGENRYGLTSCREDDQDTQFVQVCVCVCVCVGMGVCGYGCVWVGVCIGGVCGVSDMFKHFNFQKLMQL